ncbi:MAG: sigma-54 dependent transcriptional regulator [Thermodesulfobacteriota bacterium]
MAERSHKILVIDDEQHMRLALLEALRRGGYDVLLAEDGRFALEMVARERPDLVISDIRMPEMDGLELLARIRETDASLPVVMITGYGTVETAVQAMKLGAADYIMKPFPVEVIEETVARVLARLEGPAAATAAVRRRGERGGPRPIIGRSEPLLRVLERAQTVASSKATVLILGESGTGKELVARLIHEASDRRHGPFVAVNCAALPESLLESELFGHEKGAFTGAAVTRKGRFELADGGTLLLDEIGEIALPLQAKLLRVLQEEEVDRLGGRSPIPIDVHVVATTNRDLAKAVQEGTFRQDLYYRLSVIPLTMPALRERPDDVPLLAEHFLRRFAERYGKDVRALSPGALDRLRRAPWPGNVRELENLLERAVLLARGEVLTPADLWDEPAPPPGPVPAASPPPPAAGSTNLWEAERQMILQALRETDDNRTHAAKLLGISIRTLRNKLHEYREKGLLE